jgi:hypothetical protein
LRLQFNVALGIERRNDVAALVGTHFVEGLVDFAKAEVGLDGLALRVDR